MRIQVIIVVLGALSVPVFFHFERERSDQEIAQLRDELSRLEQQQAQDADERRVRRHHRFDDGADDRSGFAEQLAPPPSEGSPVPGGGPFRPVPAATPAPGSMQRPVSPIEDFAQFVPTLETAYQQDTIDPSWSRTARDMVQHALFSQMPRGGKLESVECRSTLCRVQSVFDSRSEMDEFVQSALGDRTRRPWNGAMTTGPIHEDPATGEITLLTVLMREGRQLPSDTPTAESDLAAEPAAAVESGAVQ